MKERVMKPVFCKLLIALAAVAVLAACASSPQTTGASYQQQKEKEKGWERPANVVP
jgi:uncharacterized lipoprotein YajG